MNKPELRHRFPLKATLFYVGFGFLPLWVILAVLTVQKDSVTAPWLLFAILPSCLATLVTSVLTHLVYFHTLLATDKKIVATLAAVAVYLVLTTGAMVYLWKDVYRIIHYG